MNISEETRQNAIKLCDSEAKLGHYIKALSIVEKYYLKGKTVTRRTLRTRYKATKKQIAQLNFIEVTNPYYKSSSAMRLYLIAEVEDKLMSNVDANGDQWNLAD
jgi:hypothetical protein